METCKFDLLPRRLATADLQGSRVSQKESNLLPVCQHSDLVKLPLSEYKLLNERLVHRQLNGSSCILYENKEKEI